MGRMQIPLSNMLLAVWIFLSVTICKISVDDNEFESPMNLLERQALKNESRDMFYHAYRSYIKHAYPADELMPLSCSGRYRDYSNSRGDIDDILGNFSLTLIDSMDTLAILGDFEEFEKAIKLVINNVKFDNDIIVSVFETNIRVLGGLLSAHAMTKYIQKKYELLLWYNDELLTMSTDLGYRFLPAFSTSTGIPHGKVNLKYGMNDSMLENSQVTCTACAGSLILEMAALSRLSGIDIFERKAHQVMDKLWSLRHRSTDLMGTVLNVQSGDWISKESGVGAGIDSYYEYVLKAYVLFGEDHYYDRFEHHYNAVMKYISQRPMLLDVHMHRPLVNTKNYMDALQAFWPGLQVLKGDLAPAMETHEMFYQVVKKHNFIPEAFTTDLQVYWSQHLLRPEFVESTYFLYQATNDPYYLKVGKTVLNALQKYTRVPCGYAAVSDVNTGQKEDRMDSFVLSETFKYLYLLFSEPKDLPIDLNDFLFTTEAHLLPLSLSSVENERKYANYTNSQTLKDKTCPYNIDIQLVRRNIQQTIENTTLAKSMEQEIKGLLSINASDFDPTNLLHILSLKQLGISMRKDENGTLQFIYVPALAKTEQLAREGAQFIRDTAAYANMIPKNHIVNYVSFYDPNDDSRVISLNASGSAFVLGNVSDVSGFIEFAEPENLCGECTNAAKIKGKIVIVKRGQCTFFAKAKIVEAIGAKGVIIVDNEKNSSSNTSLVFTMSGNGVQTVAIPAVFLFDQDAQILMEALRINPNLMVNISKWVTKQTEDLSQNETYSEDFVNYKLPEDFEKFVTEIDKLTKQYVNVANAGDTKNPQIIQYFNISDKCEIYELLKHNRSYLSINCLQKKPNHVLFKLDPRGQGLHVRTDLFTQIFNNATDARNLDQTIREMVEFFLRPEIVFEMNVFSIIKALHIKTNLHDSNNKLKDYNTVFNETLQISLPHETNEIVASKYASNFINFEVKVPKYSHLSFFADFRNHESTFEGYVEAMSRFLQEDNIDNYMWRVLPYHINGLLKMVRSTEYMLEVIAAVRHYHLRNATVTVTDGIRDEL